MHVTKQLTLFFCQKALDHYKCLRHLGPKCPVSAVRRPRTACTTFPVLHQLYRD